MKRKVSLQDGRESEVARAMAHEWSPGTREMFVLTPDAKSLLHSHPQHEKDTNQQSCPCSHSLPVNERKCLTTSSSYAQYIYPYYTRTNVTKYYFKYQ